MRDLHYRLPRHPVRPGDPIDPGEFDVITDMPVRSIITFPVDGFSLPAGQVMGIRGYAWSGHIPVARVEISIDGGKNWRPANLQRARERFAWRRFELALEALPGRRDIVARATDTNGNSQPLDSAPWNPRGYCNNAAHRISGEIS